MLVHRALLRRLLMGRLLINSVLLTALAAVCTPPQFCGLLAARPVEQRPSCCSRCCPVGPTAPLKAPQQPKHDCCCARRPATEAKMPRPFSPDDHGQWTHFSVPIAAAASEGKFAPRTLRFQPPFQALLCVWRK